MRGVTFLASRGGSCCPVCRDRRRVWFRGVRDPDWTVWACPACTTPDNLTVIPEAALRLLWANSAPPHKEAAI